MNPRSLSLAAFLALAAACASPMPPAVPADPPAAAVPTQSPATVAPTESPAVVASSWVMPDLVGANLQDAQNAIQSLTDFEIVITTSSDASGADRSQVLDSNWTVCAQNIPPGETITADSLIDFAAVKVDESC